MTGLSDKTAAHATARVDDPRAILVFLVGTLGLPEDADGLARHLATHRIKTYMLAPRPDACRHGQVLGELDEVVNVARTEHPGVRVTVGGVSAGANLVLAWRSLVGHETPVIAMAPVVVPRFLGAGDLFKVAAGLLMGYFAALEVNTPMSKRVPLSTNPASPLYRLEQVEHLKVAASFFGMVVRALGTALIHRAATGPLYITLAGADRVSRNGAARLLAFLLPGHDSASRTFPGLAHDLGQEWHDPDWGEELARRILG
ncbi:MAG: alpha/beta hydrolase [bacterium]|nr:alpha/beta hydrolase [bacterium]